MQSTSTALARIAKSTGVQRCPPRRTDVHHILPFEQFLRTIWPADRTKNYMRLTGAKLRTAKHRIAGNRPPDYLELIALLRSEHGFAFLQFIMGKHCPAWWSGVSRAKNLGDMRRQIAQQQRRLAQLEMEIE